MLLSERLLHIANLIPECRCLADVGTDHGYIPIYCVSKGIAQTAIASDINPGPIEISRKNITKYNLADKIETRIGPGLAVLKRQEADVIVIAGMGGPLISDILLEGADIAASSDCIILQPVQYPEVLRKQLIIQGYSFEDEDIVKDENKYYHIIKAIYKRAQTLTKEAYYYTGIKTIEKRHPLLMEYIGYKVDYLNKIIHQLSAGQQAERYYEIKKLINEFEEIARVL